jgi:hypothetical protein
MKAFNGLAASANTITHLKCELVHKVWELLLDDEFMEAYEHGIVITCADGVTRRIFPRFFTYSADYPEKYVICNFPQQCIDLDSIGLFLQPYETLQNAHCPQH